MNNTKIVIYALIILLLTFAVWAFIFSLAPRAAHSQEFGGDGTVYRLANPLDWIAKYQGRRMGCCGHQDCVPVRMRIMNPRHTGGQDVYDVEYFLAKGNQGPFYIYEFPARAVHISENEYDYFCFVPKNWSHDQKTIYSDPCVENPQLECSNCFFYSPKG